MDTERMVNDARVSFERLLGNERYAEIIKDDVHLKQLLDIICDGSHYDSVLDIGTGTGYLAFPIAKLYPEASVYGIDIAEKIIEKNQIKAREESIEHLKFLSFDGMHFPFKKGYFDLMVTRHAFHHFPNIHVVVQSLKEMLREGGNVLVADPMKHEEDVSGVIDKFMSIKGDGHIEFYSKKKLESIFASQGISVKKQVISRMSFPFPPKQEYVDLFESISQRERALYQMELRNGVVWVGHIDVGNTLFEKV